MYLFIYSLNKSALLEHENEKSMSLTCKTLGWILKSRDSWASYFWKSSI